jgi:hypothetical protein
MKIALLNTDNRQAFKQTEKRADNIWFHSAAVPKIGGGTDDAMSECARPRAQQPVLFKPRYIFQPPAHPTWLRPGTAALRQRRNSTSEFGFKTAKYQRSVS